MTGQNQGRLEERIPPSTRIKEGDTPKGITIPRGISNDLYGGKPGRKLNSDGTQHYSGFDFTQGKYMHNGD